MKVPNQIQITNPVDAIYDLDDALVRAEREHRDRLLVSVAPEARQEVMALLHSWVGDPIMFEGAAIFSYALSPGQTLSIQVR